MAWNERQSRKKNNCFCIALAFSGVVDTFKGQISKHLMINQLYDLFIHSPIKKISTKAVFSECILLQTKK